MVERPRRGRKLQEDWWYTERWTKLVPGGSERSYFPWKATAIGKSATSAKTFLEEIYRGLELEDAVHIALLTLKETIEGEMNGETVEIGECHEDRQAEQSLMRLRKGIVGPPANHLLGYEGVEEAQGPRFRKLSKGRLRTILPICNGRSMRRFSSQ
jgi:20S proteasome subunit alpha 2